MGSTEVWPHVLPEDLIKKEEESLRNELEWLLNSLQETLQSLKEGLEECASLLAPQEPGSTLVVSSHRSESVKGFITRVGTRVVKGDIFLKLPSIQLPRGQSGLKLSVSTAPQAPTLVLDQLISVRTLINGCLDVVDATRWTGDATNANFIAGQLRLLYDNIQEAKQTLKGGPDVQGPWWEHSVGDNVFQPELPPNVSFHLTVSDAALLLIVRTLEPTAATPIGPDPFSAFGFRDRLTQALGVMKPASHDETGELYMYKGQEVRVKEKVRVESQDPMLMACMAKLSALEHGVAMCRRGLDVVMGRVDD